MAGQGAGFVERFHLRVGDLDPSGVGAGVESGVDTDVRCRSWSWRWFARSPRDWSVVAHANSSRCARTVGVRFHLLVPGGRWQTVILCPVWAAKVANSVLNNLVREPFEPPPSAVISNLDASG